MIGLDDMRFKNRKFGEEDKETALKEAMRNNKMYLPQYQLQ